MHHPDCTVSTDPTRALTNRQADIRPQPRAEHRPHRGALTRAEVSSGDTTRSPRAVCRRRGPFLTLMGSTSMLSFLTVFVAKPSVSRCRISTMSSTTSTLPCQKEGCTGLRRQCGQPKQEWSVEAEVELGLSRGGVSERHVSQCRNGPDCDLDITTVGLHTDAPVAQRFRGRQRRT